MNALVLARFFLCIGLVLCVFTQFYHFQSVPGLHFDEAWQGMFAHRILTEPNFFPLSAMNPYTSPIVHYILYFSFKLFGPTLIVMRATFAAMNFLTLLILIRLLMRFSSTLAAAWLTLLWALLPICIHSHRFYVELTCFHGLCFALFLWGLSQWKNQKHFPIIISALALLAGCYSHVLFVMVFAATLFVLPPKFPDAFFSKRARIYTSVLSGLLVPLSLRMGIGLAKSLPILMALLFTGLAGLGVLSLRINILDRAWHAWPRFSMRVFPILLLGAIPYLLIFLFLFWNGFWPYAHATGHLELLWIPVNLFLFIGLAFWKPSQEPKLANLFWGGFVITLLFTQLIAFKPNTRYYMIPLTLGLLWCAVRLSQLQSIRIHLATFLALVSFNLWAFEKKYIQEFETAGPVDSEFRLWIFHDSGRDFRPYQKAFSWAIEQNCQKTLSWVEDDRFMHPLNFLKLSAPEPIGTCSWTGYNLFFSHVPSYDRATGICRDGTESPVQGLKCLAHSKNWGDLAIWYRK